MNFIPLGGSGYTDFNMIAGCPHRRHGSNRPKKIEKPPFSRFTTLMVNFGESSPNPQKYTLNLLFWALRELKLCALPHHFFYRSAGPRGRPPSIRCILVVNAKIISTRITFLRHLLSNLVPAGSKKWSKVISKAYSENLVKSALRS